MARVRRERSAPYCAVTIYDCLEFIQMIGKFGKEVIPYADILSEMGLNCPTTRSFLSRISSSKQFGLITTGANKAQLTDLGMQVLRASSEQDRRQLLADAFAKPLLNAKLIKRFRGKPLPSEEQLAELLVKEYHIIDQVKEIAAYSFLESVKELDLLEGQVLCIDRAEEAPKTEQMPAPAAAEDDLLPVIPSDSARSDTGYTMEIQTLSGKAARFYLPGDMTAKDIEYLTRCVKSVLPAFLESLNGV